MNSANDSNYKNRWAILFIVVMVTFMCTLDSSIVNVALPVMAKALHVTSAGIQLVVTSYLIVISAAILVFGKLGDMLGKTKVFKFGIALFTMGSLFCGITSSLTVLVLARVVQAIGAAATMANSQGIITGVFPANERGRALGITGTFVALGAMVGPGLGGFIVDATSWEYIFLINIPIGIITLFYGLKILPKANKTEKGKLDGYGALLFSLSIFCGFISFMAMFCSVIIQPFYLQDVLKYSPAFTGLVLMVSPLVLSVVAPISGHLSDKIGSEILTFIGLAINSVGLLLMSTLNEQTSLMSMVFYIVVMTIGNGLFQSPNNSLIMSTVPKDKLGIAGSINGLVRNLGMVCGIALSTAILYNRMSFKIGHRVTNYIVGRNDAFIYGMRIVYITAAIICFIGAVLTFSRLYSSKSKSSDMVKN
ncbi:MFS transporter [Clostridium estertheticum]|uniref:MFS transporter n=1 Tax=Clostridium estertheticum TaxID=238834 RepID=UPI001CF1FEAE|nr:MFS transporter [Clostridium estertheticum]MCB2339318.1 MFS transporter [Clostridium estertheticum]